MNIIYKTDVISVQIAIHKKLKSNDYKNFVHELFAEAQKAKDKIS